MAQRTDAERLHEFNLGTLAPDDFGGAGADVEHQAPLAAATEGTGHAQVDQAALFFAADAFHRMADRRAGRGQEGRRLADGAQRGRGNHPYRARRPGLQRLAVLAQAGQHPPHRGGVDAAVPPGRAQADRLAQGRGHAHDAGFAAGHVHAHAVRAEFDRGIHRDGISDGHRFVLVMEEPRVWAAIVTAR
nr:hypothetical protein [Massilia sp. Dwa41.01b]